MSIQFAFSSGVFAAATCILLSACGSSDDIAAAPPPAASAPASAAAARTVIFVWDGLRPDSVNATDTPTLYALAQAGVRFNDNHSTYPTFTMMNGQSFATGSFPGTSGFYGNTFWTPPQAAASAPIPVGKGAGGAAQDYTDPVFTEDYAVLTTLDAYYGGQLLLVKTLFQAAQEQNLVTATVGKSGAAFIQDLKKKGYILEENTVFPLSLAQEMQTDGTALPANIVNDATLSGITLSPSNGTPTAQIGTVTFALPFTGLRANDATNKAGARATDANRYMMDAYVKYVLPKKPDLSLIWFREPDSTEHAYGPGSANYKLALAAQDDRLKTLLAGLKAQGFDKTTNVVVVSDHAHSNVSGPASLFPLRLIPAATTPATLGTVDAVNGFSTSGDVRSADLLTRNGFTHVYDGNGCASLAMSGIKADGTLVYPTTAYTDTAGLCGTAGATYQTGYFKVPATLPTGSTGDQPIVIAANGGSDYFYVPSHDAATVARLVAMLQKREEYGAIFVDSHYTGINGTLPMSTVHLENAVRYGNGQPDVVASFNFDETALINGLPGIEFESFGNNRGMHGSFSPIDVHNTLIASGPSFQSGLVVSTPSGNVDVAPTVAFLLGGTMPQADGRVLLEALAPAASASAVAPTSANVVASVLTPSSPATGIVFESPVDPTGATKDTALSAGTYSFNLSVKDLTQQGKTYRYFDSAKPVRQ